MHTPTQTCSRPPQRRGRRELMILMAMLAIAVATIDRPAIIKANNPPPAVYTWASLPDFGIQDPALEPAPFPPPAPPLPPPPPPACGVCIVNAATIVDVGRTMVVNKCGVTKLGKRAWVIAVATAMQESSLHNLASTRYAVTYEPQFSPQGDGSDHDSVGLFQQRPQSGWGTPQELMQPRIAAQRFYNALVCVLAQHPNWKLTQLAQKVQGSAFPNAYQKHEAKATEIVDYVLTYVLSA